MKLAILLSIELLLAGCGYKPMPKQQVEPITIDWCHHRVIREQSQEVTILHPSGLVPHGMCLDCDTGHIVECPHTHGDPKNLAIG